MIFWILVGAAVIVIGWVVLWNGLYEDWGEGILFGFLALIASALLVPLLTWTAHFAFPGAHTDEEKFELRAIGTDSSIEGRSYFLGGGYVDGHRTLNYIAQEDGWSRIAEADARASRVYEDSDDPSVTEYTHSYWNEWVLPGKFITGSSWDFHVPAGSVLEDYSITNE